MSLYNLKLNSHFSELTKSSNNLLILPNAQKSPRKELDTLISTRRSKRLYQSRSSGDLFSRNNTMTKVIKTAAKESPIKTEAADSLPVDYDNTKAWNHLLIKDQTDQYFDHMIHNSSKVWSFNSTLGFNNTARARHDLSIYSGQTGRFLVLLKKYSIDRDKETLKQLKVIKKLCLSELEYYEFEIRNVGVLSSVLGVIQALFIQKELTNDLGVDKIKLQSKLSSLFKLAADPSNADQLSVDFHYGVTSFLYVFNYLVLNEVCTHNFVVDLLKYMKMCQDILKRVSDRHRAQFKTILKSNSCERSIYYFDLDQFKSHPADNTQFEILTQLLVSFKVMNKQSQVIDKNTEILTQNTCMFMLEVLSQGAKDQLEGQLLTISTQKTIGQVSFLINVKKQYQKDTTQLLNNQVYHLIDKGVSLKGSRIQDGTLKNILVLLNVQKHCKFPKLYEQALKMLVTMESESQKKLMSSRVKLPSLNDRPQGLQEGELGVLWVLYEFINIHKKEKEAKHNSTQVTQDTLFSGFPGFDIFL